MKKTRLSLLLLAVFATTFGVALVLAPTPAQADCWCSQAATTAELMGEGTDCATAQADLQAQLDAAAGCSSFCSKTVVITEACHLCTCHGAYHVHGYMEYQCYTCNVGGGGPGGDPLPV